MLKHARLKLFQHFLRPYQVTARRRRSRWFTKAMSIEPGMRVIDLGGSPMIWALVAPLPPDCPNAGTTVAAIVIARKVASIDGATKASWREICQRTLGAASR
jgi:hypothetical protein